MKVVILQCGKTKDKAVIEITQEFLRRLKKYITVEEQTLTDIKFSKSTTQIKVKTMEGDMVLKSLKSGDFMILLDEKGKEFTSVGFAQKLQSLMNQGPKRLVFVIGGPYGFSQEVYNKANLKISLSKMTFSHQIFRAIFAEQLYRAFSILNNDPYHHE